MSEINYFNYFNMQDGVIDDIKMLMWHADVIYMYVKKTPLSGSYKYKYRE
jgi:hypothetical protein